MDRRHFLGFGALAGAAAFVAPRFAFAAESAGPTRFVFLILRGALDGLAAVPPWGDVDYAPLRRELAIAAPGQTDGALALDGRFGLHPSLGFLHDSYAARELLVLHAVASPYRDRSHFDGQDVLEGGGVRAHETATGWLNRALLELPPGGPVAKERGIALGQNVPLVMRGPAAVASWSPARMPSVDEDTLQRITDLYSGDPLLSKRLADALVTDALATDAVAMNAAAMSDMASAPNVPGGPDAGTTAAAATATARNRYLETVQAAAGFLKRPDGPQVAVFDTLGWDTHANEGGARGALAQRLGVLDVALRTLKDSLGDTWSRTVVLVATEFGRTAAVNGTRGSDHGTGAAAFLLGGAVRGGRVIADWPGLAPAALYERRDLAPTTDLRAVMKGVLRDHLGVREDALEARVFPQSRPVRPLDGLIRV
jgi:uncharacterized protein (DUF1501 family)